MVTHLEPDILESEVKWVLGSITMNKTNVGGGIPAELFQILKDDAVKVLHSICQQIWKTQQQPQDCKRSVFKMPKNVQTTIHLHSFHMLARLCSKSFKLGFSNMWPENFHMYKLDWERQNHQRSNCQHPMDHRKSKRIPKKYIFLLHWPR